MIEEAILLEDSKFQEIIAFMHVWGYSKKKASNAEKEHFKLLLDMFQYNDLQKDSILDYFRALLLKYPDGYLQSQSFLFPDKGEVKARGYGINT